MWHILKRHPVLTSVCVTVRECTCLCPPIFLPPLGKPIFLLWFTCLQFSDSKEHSLSCFYSDSGTLWAKCPELIYLISYFRSPILPYPNWWFSPESTVPHSPFLRKTSSFSCSLPPPLEPGLLRWPLLSASPALVSFYSVPLQQAAMLTFWSHRHPSPPPPPAWNGIRGPSLSELLTFGRGHFFLSWHGSCLVT